MNARRGEEGREKMQTLAILVTAERHLDLVLAIARAGIARGKSIQVLLTAGGVRLALRPALQRLGEQAMIRICTPSFERCGLHGREAEVAALASEPFATPAQIRHLLKTADRYVVL